MPKGRPVRAVKRAKPARAAKAPKAAKLPRIAKKRSYLAKDDRKQALLQTAAAVVEKQGWAALSMISVAEQARVSRQLVYQHFATLDELMGETMTHIFREGYERVRASIAQNAGNVADLQSSVDAMTGDLSPERARALWQMIAGAHSGSPEAARLSRRLRHLLTKLWLPVADEAFGVKDTHARVLIWMLHMAYWGAQQLVWEGETDRDTAMRMFLWMVAQAQAGSDRQRM
jgi:AcrR family transcriptional regulator